METENVYNTIVELYGIRETLYSKNLLPVLSMEDKKNITQSIVCQVMPIREDYLFDVAIAQYKGKLGILLIIGYTSAEETLDIQPSYRGSADGFRYDSIKVYLADGCRTTYCVATEKGNYVCLKIEVFEEDEDCIGIDENINLKHLGTFKSLAECLSLIPDEFKEFKPDAIASDRIENLAPGQIFVFGSNPQGECLAGASKLAYEKFGAENGVGHGLTGRSYALTTTEGSFEKLEKEVDAFYDFAFAHPELEFLVTKVGTGGAGFNEKDVAPLFHPCRGTANVILPMDWIEGLLTGNKKIYSTENNGRSSLEEWMGDLAVLYSVAKGIDLSFDGGNISINDANKDDILSDIVSRFNVRHEGPGKIEKLKAYYEKNKSEYNFNQLYKEFLLDILNKKCSDIEEGTTVNPSNFVCSFVNDLLKEKHCKKIYCPFSGAGAFFRAKDESCGWIYTNQEPSSSLHLISLLYKDVLDAKDKCVCGDFNTDWLAEGHDTLVCIPPISYDDSFENKSTRDRCRQIMATLLHKIILDSPSIKTAIIFVNEDFLYHDDFRNAREVMCNKNCLDKVVHFGSHDFTDVSSGGAVLILDFNNAHDSVCFSELGDPGEQSVVDELSGEIIEPLPLLCPVSYLAENDYCLVRDLYNFPYFKSDEEIYDYIPLREILELQPQSPINHNEGYFFPWDVRSQPADILAGSTGHDMPSRSPRPLSLKIDNGSLAITKAGALLCKRKSGVLYSSIHRIGGIRPLICRVKDRFFIESIIYHLYGRKICYGGRGRFMSLLSFLMRHQTPSFTNKWQEYALSWRIPVAKDPKERAAINDQIKKQLKKKPSSNRYNILTIGNIDAVCLKENGFELAKELDSTKGDEFKIYMNEASFRQNINAIVLDADTDHGQYGYSAIKNLCNNCQDKAVYISCEEGTLPKIEEYINEELSEKMEYFKDKIFERREMDKLCENMRENLDSLNSPETKVKREHPDAFAAANNLDKRFSLSKNVTDNLQEILVSLESGHFKTFDGIRNLRDCLFERMKQDNIIPAALDYGAIPSLLSKRYYNDSNTDEEYYMLSKPIPEEICAGLEYMTGIANASIHEGKADKWMGTVAVNILISFIKWFDEEYDKYTGLANYTTYRARIGEFKKGDPSQVHITSRNGSPYYYSGNVHLSADKEHLNEGDFIVFDESPKAEQQPYIDTDKGLEIIFYSKKWRKCKPN